MTTYMRVRAPKCALVCLVLAAGCRSPMNVSPTVEGTVVQLTSDPLMILVERAPDQCGYWFLVDSRSEIRLATSPSVTVAADSDRLGVGVEVRVWADGDMLLSCPARGRAERVIVEP
jgi:hypothetical protein